MGCKHPLSPVQDSAYSNPSQAKNDARGHSRSRASVIARGLVMEPARPGTGQSGDTGAGRDPPPAPGSRPAAAADGGPGPSWARGGGRRSWGLRPGRHQVTGNRNVGAVILRDSSSLAARPREQGIGNRNAGTSIARPCIQNDTAP